MRSTSALLAALLWSGTAAAEAPLSAIDWLSEMAPATVTPPAPTAETATRPDVTVTPLGASRVDAAGLLPGTTTGLPRTLWSASATATLTRALGRLPARPLPAMQALYYTLLLAEADAPPDITGDAPFLRARIAALRRFGAVEPALALVERAGGATPALFDAWLDLALLDGREDAACAALAAAPHLSRDLGARIYCLARAGDWQTAALILHGAEASGAITEPDGTLLALYLEPELIDAIAAPVPPTTMTPLRFRLYEAIGTPLGTQDLPRAFAMADLRGTAGWKAEIEAAERLAQTGALAAARLFALYTARKPAASGGVWTRVAAVQALDRALDARDGAALAEALPAAWEAARAAGLETALAEIFAERVLAAAPLPAEAQVPAEAQARATEMILLSPLYERAHETHAPAAPRDRLLAGIARGAPEPADATTRMQSAIAAGFAATAAAPEHQRLINEGRLGEAILMAAALLDHGAERAAPSAVRAAIATLRAVGLEDTARRAALQILILGPGT
ncbi:hypothetical protein ABIE58_003549 [Roseovarius sp. MBR-78]|uniref:hypothetical protein n=1 Tax=Roseovarius sp. MBR-78 TaxID=3156460 RepID=UPI003396AC59